MLVHIPAYALKNDLDYWELKNYLVQMGVVLNSYYKCHNDAPLLITTNSTQIYEPLKAFRQKSGYEFDLQFVTEQELDEVFPALPGEDFNDNYKKFFQSKFYPMMKRMDEQIIHVDYDIIFLRKVDFAALNKKDITLIRNYSGPEVDYEPWINSGFFSIQNGGFDLIEEEFVNHYVESPSNAATTDENYKWIPEEFLFNKMHRERPEQVEYVNNYHLNFPAYNLQDDPEWPQKTFCVHYHHLKASSCIVWESGVQFFQIHAGMDHLERINKDFYRSLLLFTQHLLEVNNFFVNGEVEKHLEGISDAVLADLMKEHFQVAHFSELCN